MPVYRNIYSSKEDLLKEEERIIENVSKLISGYKMAVERRPINDNWELVIDINTGNNVKRQKIEEMLNYFKKINNLSPFPIIDTEHIMNLENKLKNNCIDYDAEPVTCCSHCHSLYLLTDDDDNDSCVLCKNSLNEIEIHQTIFHYLNKYPEKQ